MKLYYTQGACSLAVRIILYELQIQATYESVNLDTKKTESGENLLAINPKGSVPALKLDNGEVLTEAAVILQYLGDQAQNTQLLPLQADFNRYHVLEWLNYIATEVHKSMGFLFHPNLNKEVKEQILTHIIPDKFKFINNQIQHHQFLIGDEFTLPDAYLFVILRWALQFKINLDEYAYLARYYERLQTRPCIVKALKEEGLKS